MVDDNYNFTCIDIGSYGSYSDGGIFAKSALQKAINENALNIPTGSVILGDEAFPLKNYLMKPYPKRNQLTVQEKFTTIGTVEQGVLWKMRLGYWQADFEYSENKYC